MSIVQRRHCARTNKCAARLTQKEFETAVDNLTDDEFNDFDANFKAPLALKIELNIFFLVVGAGSILGIADIVITFRDAIGASWPVRIVLAVVGVGASYLFFRWFYFKLFAWFRRQCLERFMKEKGCLRTMIPSKE